MTTSEAQEALEPLIDACGVAGVLDALAGVCWEKAEHINANWQDAALAKAWTKVGDKLGELACVYEKSDVPGIHT